MTELARCPHGVKLTSDDPDYEFFDECIECFQAFLQGWIAVELEKTDSAPRAEQ